MSYRSWELDGLYVLRWGARPELKDVGAYVKEIASARERQGKPLVGLIIMPPDSAAPDESFRKAQASQLPTIFSNLEFAICVFEGTGFIASLKRSALVGILLLSPRRYPVFVRPTLEDALVRDPPKPFSFDAGKALLQLRQRVAA
jgi:hypothetical protein